MMSWRNSIFICLVVAVLVLCHPAPSAADSSYDELVTLFNDFREYQETPISEGLPDFSPAAMDKQFRGLQEFKNRLAALETSSWPVWQKVDYHLVRAELNAMEFFHKVHRPWARDPGFYSVMGGDAGATMDVGEFFDPVMSAAEPVMMMFFMGREMEEMEFSLSQEEQAAMQAALAAIPGIYEQAKSNLTEAARDFAEFAIRNLEMEVALYETLGQALGKGYPDLAGSATGAAVAVRNYIQWLEENKHEMAEKAGLGKENYDWWQRNVLLTPWGWDESNQIIQQEYNRAITFLKLEEHRNRELPPLDAAMSERAYHESLRQALHYVTDFLKNDEIMTIDDWVDPSDYYLSDGRGTPSDLEDIDDSPSPEFLAGNTNVDMKYRQREILPGETHEYIGHMLDEQRQERLTRSPIRSAERRFNMASRRQEGWAVSLEELLMQVGVLDERPRRGREMVYIMLSSHMSLAIPDMKMQANEINLAEARQLCADITPRGWTRPNEDVVYFEMQSNLRNPGGFHSNVVSGKAYFMKLFRERAQALGDDFVIRDFIDEFLSSGVIPMSLIRWEMTGNNDDVTLVTEDL